IYLLFGLLLHKAVWEFMKSPPGASAVRAKARSSKAQVLSAIKVLILLGIIAQTVLPVMLPLAEQPSAFTMHGILLYTSGLIIALTGRIQLGRNWTDIEKSYAKDEHRLVSHGLY